jgi:hypothetical protein
VSYRPGVLRNRLGSEVYTAALKIINEPFNWQRGPDDPLPTKLEEAMRNEHRRNPGGFLKFVRSLLPHDLAIEHTRAAADLADDEIDRMLERLRQEERMLIDVTPKPKALIDGGRP